VHCYDVYTGLFSAQNIWYEKCYVGIPLLRIVSASPRSFVKSFEQRDALGSRTNSQMLSDSRLHYKPFDGTRSAREKEVASR